MSGKERLTDKELARITAGPGQYKKNRHRLIRWIDKMFTRLLRK